MSMRVFKTPLDPVYGRAKSAETCKHLPEAHVAYDRLAAGYRAGAWCQCRKVKVNGRRLYETCREAEIAGSAMLALLLRHRT